MNINTYVGRYTYNNNFDHFRVICNIVPQNRTFCLLSEKSSTRLLHIETTNHIKFKEMRKGKDNVEE